MYMIYFITTCLFAAVIAQEPPMKDYFIDGNQTRCSLLSLGANISVTYGIINGSNAVADITFANATNSQNGTCNQDLKSEFNIALSEKEKVVFNFENVNSTVVWKDVKFIYELPNTHFPDAKQNGTFVASVNVNKTLSTTSQYYKCLSTTSFSLQNDVTLNIYGIKLKVFDVVNSSFGDDLARCPQDLSSSTNIPTTFTLPSESSTKLTSPSTTIVTTTSIVSTVTTIASTTKKATTTATSTAQSTTKVTKTATTTVTPSPNSTQHPSTSSMHTTSRPYITTMPSTDPKFAVRGPSSVCLLLQSKMTLTVMYPRKDGKERTAVFPVTSANRIHGNCNTSNIDITILFSQSFFFTLSFTQNNKLAVLSQFNTQILLTDALFPDARDQNLTVRSAFSLSHTYEVKVGNVYSCAANLTMGNATLYLKVQDFKFEAFRQNNGTDFSSEVTNCSKDPMVAIIVGVVLAVFLIIVVVVFIIFRIRAKRRQGYQEI